MRQNCQASNIVLKIQNADKKAHAGLPSNGVFAALVIHLTPFASKGKNIGSCFCLANEIL